VWNKIQASNASGTQAQGKDDTTQGLTSTAKDLAKLMLHLLNKSGPVETCRKTGVSVLDSMWKPAGAWDALDEHPEGHLFESGDADEVGGFTVTQAGWMDSIYRGKKRLSVSGGLNIPPSTQNGGCGGSGTTIQMALFPTEGFGIVVCCNSSFSHLPLSLANIASDLLLNASTPSPWITRLKPLASPLPKTTQTRATSSSQHPATPYPLTKMSSSIGSISVPSNAQQNPPRPLSSYVGHYGCKEVSGLMFNVMTTAVDNKGQKEMLHVRQVTNTGDGGQFTSILVHMSQGKLWCGYLFLTVCLN
jgi:hypothetical protein